MEVLGPVLEVLGSLFLAVLITRCFRLVWERKFVPSRYEWLLVLNHQTWKHRIQLSNEMRECTHATCDFVVTLKYDLQELLKESLIERKYQLLTIEDSMYMTDVYRLSPAGARKLAEVTNVSPEAVALT